MIMTLASALTGGAVLRAAGRIYLGVGAVAGDEERGPTEKEQEKSDPQLWLMLAPCVLWPCRCWQHPRSMPLP
jgi:multicomponent Na+:H+ antiporter subunit D